MIKQNLQLLFKILNTNIKHNCKRLQNKKKFIRNYTCSQYFFFKTFASL